MKYKIFILTIILAIPVFALAARIVPGTVPQLQPLQPPPAGAGPNIQHNIVGSPGDLNPTNPFPSDASSSPSSSTESGVLPKAAVLPALPPTPSNNYATIITVVLAVLIAGVLIKRYAK